VVGNIARIPETRRPEDVAALEKNILDMVNDPRSGEMKQDITKIYSETFSKTKLDQILRLLRHTLGQVMLTKQPRCRRKCRTAMIAERRPRFGPKIQKMARRFRDRSKEAR